MLKQFLPVKHISEIPDSYFNTLDKYSTALNVNIIQQFNRIDELNRLIKTVHLESIKKSEKYIVDQMSSPW